MRAAELQRLEQTLRRNRIWLRRFLDDPLRLEDELHLLVAARLRVLLCDGSDPPALIEFAREAGGLEDLVVWGPYDYQGRRAFPPEHAAWDPADLWPKRPRTARYPIRQYLESYVGEWRIRRVEGGWMLDGYTPLDLIRWASNSESLHHIPSSATQAKKLRGVRRHIVLPPADEPPEDVTESSEEVLAAALFSLGEWTVSAIEHLVG